MGDLESSLWELIPYGETWFYTGDVYPLWGGGGDVMP